MRDHYLSINAEGNIITVPLPEPIIVYAGIDMVRLIETEPMAEVPTYGALITARAPSNQRWWQLRASYSSRERSRHKGTT